MQRYFVPVTINPDVLAAGLRRQGVEKLRGGIPRAKVRG